MKTITVKVMKIPGLGPLSLDVKPGTTVRELLERTNIKNEYAYVVGQSPQDSDEVPSSFPLTVDCKLLITGKVHGSGYPKDFIIPKIDVRWATHQFTVALFHRSTVMDVLQALDAMAVVYPHPKYMYLNGMNEVGYTNSLIDGDKLVITE